MALEWKEPSLLPSSLLASSQHALDASDGPGVEGGRVRLLERADVDRVLAAAQQHQYR